MKTKKLIHSKCDEFRLKVPAPALGSTINEDTGHCKRHRTGSHNMSTRLKSSNKNLTGAECDLAKDVIVYNGL